MSRHPEPSDIMSIASVAGTPVDVETAVRIVSSISPALETFAPIGGTLPFDVEPASFVAAQLRTQRP